MPKRDDQHSMAEDYLAQLNSFQQPRYRGRHSWPWWTEPKWKYQPVIDRGRVAPPLVRFLVIGGFIALVGYLLYRAIFLTDGFAIYFSVVLLFIGAIIFFAARDFAKPKDNDTDD
jgi:hypothetical protein